MAFFEYVQIKGFVAGFVSFPAAEVDPIHLKARRGTAVGRNCRERLGSSAAAKRLDNRTVTNKTTRFEDLRSISDLYSGLAFVSRRLRIDRRVFITAFALVLALLASYALFRYTSYRKVQANFYGQALVPAEEAYDFHLVDQNGKAFQLSRAMLTP